jgi:hypothetical protein
VKLLPKKENHFHFSRKKDRSTETDGQTESDTQRDIETHRHTNTQRHVDTERDRQSTHLDCDTRKVEVEVFSLKYAILSVRLSKYSTSETLNTEKRENVVYVYANACVHAYVVA